MRGQQDSVDTRFWGPAFRRLPWYVKFWLCLTLVAEAFFIPAMVAYRVRLLWDGPQHVTGGDAFVGAVGGALFAPFAMIFVTLFVWLFVLYFRLISGRDRNSPRPGP